MTEPSDGAMLAGLGLDDIPTLTDNVYPGYLTDCKMIQTKAKGDKPAGQSIVFTYKVDMPGDPLNGQTIDEWKSANVGDSAVQKRFLKQRLESLGVPESKFNVFVPRDVIGLAVAFTVKKNGEYTNVTKVELRSESGNPNSPTVAGQTVTQDVTSQL